MDKEVLRQQINASVDSSNGILGDQEQSVVRELLNESYGVVSSIDTEIKALQARRAKELERIARLRVGVSPQKHVPPEILSNVFKFCVDDESYVVNIPLNPDTQGLILSQICSRWRRVALAEPSLWNVVFLWDPPRVLPEILEAILSRAGRTITFRLSMVFIPPPVLRIIHEYSDMFQEVELRFRLSPDVELFEDPFARLGALRKIRLFVEDASYDPCSLDLYCAISVFENSWNAPQLDFELITDGVALDLRNAESLAFPWPHLNHLVIDCYLTLAEFIDILEEWQCIELVSCNVNVHCDDRESADIPDNIIFLPNLGSLTLMAHDSDADKFFDSIVTPSLEVLVLRNGFIRTDTLLGFIQKSHCNIRTIDVSLSPTPTPAIKQLLLAIPSVTKLSLMGPIVVSEAILDSINTWDLVPLVEVLECCVSSCRAVRELIFNRCESSPGGSKKAIREFTAWVPEEDITVEWQELQVAQLQNKGVEFRLGLR